MDENNHSVDPPSQSDPGTPLPRNAGTPRNERNDDTALVSSTADHPMPHISGFRSMQQQPGPKYSQCLAVIEKPVDPPEQSDPVTPLPRNPGTPRNERDDVPLVSSSSYNPTPRTGGFHSVQPQPRPNYSQLLDIIEHMGKDIRPTFAGSRRSAERLKRGIAHARFLVRECVLEMKRNARS